MVLRMKQKTRYRQNRDSEIPMQADGLANQDRNDDTRNNTPEIGSGFISQQISKLDNERVGKMSKVVRF